MILVCLIRALRVKTDSVIRRVSPPEWAGVRAQVGGVSPIFLNKFPFLNLVDIRVDIIAIVHCRYWYCICGIVLVLAGAGTCLIHKTISHESQLPNTGTGLTPDTGMAAARIISMAPIHTVSIYYILRLLV